MMQIVPRSLIWSALLVSTVHPARAAECTVKVEPGTQLQLIDAKGQKSVLEYLDSEFVRRTDTLPQAPGNAKLVVEAYRGFFAETITTTSDRPSLIQYYKLSSDDYSRLRAFLPPKPGASMTVDYEAIIVSATAPIPAAPLPPSRRWQATYTVTSADDMQIGDCTFKTVVIDGAAANADKTFNSETRHRYAPALRAWVSLQATYRPTGQPESKIDRTMVSIAPLPKD
jgi:hypothetical protein